MNINQLLTFFVPKDKIFFTLFTQASANLVEISAALKEFLNTNSKEKRMEYFKLIEELEHKGDAITHDIFKELSTNFITPFDREDIHYLATSLDDVADFIHGSAKQVELYKVEEITPAMKKLGELIEWCAKEVHVAVSNLRDLNNIVRIKEALVRINSLENHADDVFDSAIAELFDHEKDPIRLIKIKGILGSLELATDKCEDVANSIESVIIKNS
jgi:predicted phosphate transport protein (TIGR00153 family)